MQKYNRVVIRDIIRVNLDDLIMMLSAIESNLAYWNDGVLFACFTPTESEALAISELQGVIHFDRVFFTKHPTFTRTVKSTTNFEIPVINVQNSELYSELIKWLKSQPVWND